MQEMKELFGFDKVTLGEFIGAVVFISVIYFAGLVLWACLA